MLGGSASGAGAEKAVFNIKKKRYLFSSTTNVSLEDTLEHVGFKDVKIVMADELPPNLQEFMISNTDPSSKPGQHWVLFMPAVGMDNRVMVFDSFAQDIYDNPYYSMGPYLPREWAQVIHVQGKGGRRSLQSGESKLCGQYCIGEWVTRHAFNTSLARFLSLVEMPMDKSEKVELSKLALNDRIVAIFLGELKNFTSIQQLRGAKADILKAVEEKREQLSIADKS